VHVCCCRCATGAAWPLPTTPFILVMQQQQLSQQQQPLSKVSYS